MNYDYSYGYGSAMPDIESSLAGAPMAVVSGILAVALILYVAYIAFALICYIFRALGLYTIAKRRGIHNAWLAWIPVGTLWVLGSVSDQYQYMAKGKIKKRRNVLMGLSVALVILAIPMGLLGGFLTAITAADASALVGGLLTVLLAFATVVISIICAVFQYMALYDLFRSCAHADAALYLILSILFPVTEPFMVFANRNKDNGMPPRRTATQSEVVQESVAEAQIVDDEVTDEDFVEI